MRIEGMIGSRPDLVVKSYGDGGRTSETVVNVDAPESDRLYALNEVHETGFFLGRL